MKFPGAGRMLPVLAIAAAVAGGCIGADSRASPNPSASASPGASVSDPPSTAGPTTQEPRPTTSVPAITPMPPPPGTSLVEIPAAGLAIPVPDGWQRLDAADLADPAVRQELARTYPAADAILEAIIAAGDRTEVAFLAVGPPTASADAIPENIAVLVAQPTVSGFLLDLATGFIDAGLQDALGLDEPERSRAQTPAGEGIRLEYAMPAPTAAPSRLVAWVIGAPDATVLITTVTPLDAGAAVDPDRLVAATEVR